MLDSMGVPKTNAFELELEKLMVSTKFLEVLQPFWSFLDGFEKKRVHNMLDLMLDPKVKSL
jgi:hypothetical protein